MAARHALSGFPYPDQESQVMNAWDRLVCGAELPANAVRTKSTLYLKIDKYGLNTTLRQARQHDR
jgi:hypothetical protein